VRPEGRFTSGQRVRKRPEFLRIQAGAQRVTTPHFVLLVQARGGEGAPGARLGITVSRKIGNAVVRNRAKRLIREAFRATRALWPPDIDLVVIVKRPTGEAKLEDVVDEWLGRAELIERRIQQTRKDRERRAPLAPKLQ
jgi:ribonuclease P protein component